MPDPGWPDPGCQILAGAIWGSKSFIFHGFYKVFGDVAIKMLPKPSVLKHFRNKVAVAAKR